MASSFFVEAANWSRQAYWHKLFQLAWGSEGKNLIINLAEVPYDILPHLEKWREDRVEEENAAIERAKQQR